MKLFTLIAGAVVFAVPLFAQREAAEARFEVASIKEIPAPDDPRRITCGLPGIMPS